MEVISTLMLVLFAQLLWFLPTLIAIALVAWVICSVVKSVFLPY